MSDNNEIDINKILLFKKEEFKEDSLINKTKIIKKGDVENYYYLEKFSIHRKLLHGIFLAHSGILCGLLYTDHFFDVKGDLKLDVWKAHKIKVAYWIVWVILVENIFREYLYIQFRRDKEDSFINQFKFYYKHLFNSYFGLKYLFCKLGIRRQDFDPSNFKNNSGLMESVFEVKQSEIQSLYEKSFSSLHSMIKESERLEEEIKLRIKNLSNTSVTYLTELDEIEELKGRRNLLNKRILEKKKGENNFNNLNNFL